MKTFSRFVAIALSLAAVPAMAHDPEQFDRLFGKAAVARPIPSTCKQLAAPEGFDVDASNPAVVELFNRCDAEAKAQQRKAAADAKVKPMQRVPKAGTKR